MCELWISERNCLTSLQSGQLLTVISEGDVVQPAASAGQPHSLWENENMMQSEANLLSQHLNEQSTAEAQGHASPTDQLLLLALFHDPPTPTPNTLQSKGFLPARDLGHSFPQDNRTDRSMLTG